LRDKIIELIHKNEHPHHKMEMVREPEPRFYWPTAGYFRAPVFIILTDNPRTKDAYPLSAKMSKGESNFISGLVISFTYMQLAASTFGLSCQWVASIGMPYVQSLTKELLGVPAELVFYDILAARYPDAAFVLKPRSVRPK
jgi:nitroreductase